MKDFTDLLRQVEQRDDFWVESAKLSFVVELNRLLQKGDMKYADLARRIDRTPAYISKIMAGDTNFTIDTMTKLARAVGGELNISIAPSQRKKENYTTKKYQDIFIVNNQGALEGRYQGTPWDAFLINDGAENEAELAAA